MVRSGGALLGQQNKLSLGEFTFRFAGNVRRRAQNRCGAPVRAVHTPAEEISAVWEEHIKQEFAKKDTEATIRTMVPHASVNGVPTLTGGKGHNELRRFYSEDFLNAIPDDTKTTPVHRVMGSSAIVDEMILDFTHDQEVPWMLPGVAPTHKKVSIPLVLVVLFEGDKLLLERLYWDQASVLVQLGLLDPKLLPGRPVTGAEQAAKVLDFDSVPSYRAMEDVV